jgi:serine/threonine protein kinase/dienelactone hydrolase
MIGKTILHYKILEKLGEGGMGVVYLAEDIKLKRQVAIKFLPRHISTNSEERERFEIEAQAAAALNHPNIATIHVIEEFDDELFIVMEYIKGNELRKLAGSGSETPVSINNIINYAIQIVAGLKTAHTKGITHRDIKSANIMISEDGRIKIMDFGLAKVGGGALVTKAGSTIGTAAYMSPEQTRGEKIDARTDIWSFGVVLYELITGQLPFKGDYEQAVIYSILNDEIEPVSNYRNDIPEILQKIVNRSLAKNVEDRYISTDKLLEDLTSLKQSQEGSTEVLSISKTLRKPVIIIPTFILLAALVFLLIWWFWQNSRIRQARNDTLQIEMLTSDLKSRGNGIKSWAAFRLSEEVAKIIPEDPVLQNLYPKFSRYVKIYSEPSNAKVFAKAYGDTSKEWRYIGKTPLDSINFPIGFSRIKIEKEGYRSGFDIVWNAAYLNDTLSFKLTAEGQYPDEMNLIPEISRVYDIPAAPAGLHMPGLEQFEPVDLGDFLMDRHEVTNHAYKKFVDADGYQNKKYWRYPFINNGRKLTWQEAMALFMDKTGQPGPATWEVGDYPEGQDSFPVSGVSFYEAAAYAQFAGKNLPTIYHWDRAALTWASSAIVPLSNLTKKGPLPAGGSKSMNRFGIYDMAGNVREWCLNKSSRGGYFILGGGWNDPAYGFNDAYAQSPFDRTETNGFRCIRYLEGEASHEILVAEIKLPFRDFMNETPVSDQTFKFFLNQYAYDKSPLNDVIDEVTESQDWIREEITFNAAYGAERMKAYLFLPRHGKPPYQTVIYFPGSGAIHTRSSASIEPRWTTEFFMKSGRAFMFPIYKSTYEREDALKSDYPEKTNFWKDHVIMWAKDFSRSIDYLETREDIDSEKLVYYGVSWGGAMGGIIPAVEKRIKGSVLLVAGLLFQRALPEAEPVNFLPRITIPVLMLNGKYDFFFPYETSQLPFYELLGTSKEHKTILVYEGGHTVPKTELVKETLAWLDRYLGPVSK